jgi:hypothetical protein
MTMKLKDHDHIVDRFKDAKCKHLERLATKLLKKDDQAQKLRQKPIDREFFKFFEDGD